MDRLKRYIGTFFVWGFALGMGLLSFAGVVGLMSSVPAALAALLFTVIIIGSVYKHSILNGVKRLFTRHYTEREGIRDALVGHFDNCLDKSTLTADEVTYIHNYLTFIGQSNDHAAQGACMKQENAWLAAIKKNQTGLPDFAARLKRHLVWRQRVVSPFALLCASAAGMSMFMGVVGATAGQHGAVVSILKLCHVSMATPASMHLATHVAMLVGICVAALAAVSFTFAMYHTLMKFFNPQRVVAWKNGFVNDIKGGDSLIKRVLLPVVVLLTIALSITATVLTAGGWGHAALVGMRHFSSVSAKAGYISTMATVPFYLLAFFAFSITHSVSSMTRFVKTAKNPFSVMRDRVLAYVKKHGVVQACNPFRIIMLLLSVPLKISIFILHNLSEAFVNVKSSGAWGIWATGVITLDDAATEAYEIFHDHDHGRCHQHGSHSKQAVEAKEGKLAAIQAKLSHESLTAYINAHEPHEHGPLDKIIAGLQYLVLFFWHPLAALWDGTFGNCGRTESRTLSHAFKSSWEDFHTGPSCSHRAYHHGDGHGCTESKHGCGHHHDDGFVEGEADAVEAWHGLPLYCQPCS